MKKNMMDDMVSVDDILLAIDKINRFCHGVTKKQFLKNEILCDAVARNLEIAGEASSRLSAAFKKNHEEIEWRKIIGMRNRMIHAYDMVDYGIVWDVIKKDLPKLESNLRKIIDAPA